MNNLLLVEVMIKLLKYGNYLKIKILMILVWCKFL